jgi:hypothetical protein
MTNRRLLEEDSLVRADTGKIESPAESTTLSFMVSHGGYCITLRHLRRAVPQSELIRKAVLSSMSLPRHLGLTWAVR